MTTASVSTCENASQRFRMLLPLLRPTAEFQRMRISGACWTRQIASEADLPADTRGGEGGSQSEKDKAGDRFAKLDTVLPPTHAAAPGSNRGADE